MLRLFSPGIVSDVNPDGAFTVVNLDKGNEIRDFRGNQSQTYHIYHEGMSALYKDLRGKQKVYEPITIVGFIENSAIQGFEIHGKYEFTYDGDKRKIIHYTKAKQ